jgi:hypothetical protein
MFKVEMDPGDFNKLFSDLPKVTKAATANALNVVARKVNKNVKDRISETYNVKKGAMKFGDLVSIKRADARRDIAKAVIFIKRKSRGLMKYGAKTIASGISVKVKKSAKTIAGGFIAPLQSGSADEFAFIKATGSKAGITTRKTKKGTPYKAAKRQILYGPPISDLYTNKRAEGVILKTIDVEFQKELDKQFNKQFEKRGRR